MATNELEDAARAVVNAWDRKDYLEQHINRLRKALAAGKSKGIRISRDDPRYSLSLGKTPFQDELEKFDAERGRD